MDLVTILAAAEEGHKSETPLFVAGGLLAAFAVIAGLLGIKRPDLPGSAKRAIMVIEVVLVAATLVASIAVS